MTTTKAGPSWVAVAAVIGAALLVVLLIVQWAGRERADAVPRSVADVEATITRGGLVVCSSRPVGDPSGAGAVEGRALEVGGGCAPGEVATVTVTRFVDVDARDAAARSVEGLVRPRGSAALYTAGDLTILVAGDSEDAPRSRLGEVLIAAGAR